MSDISTRLKSLRLSRNLTQKQLAEEIGESESGVQNYELGTRKPNHEKVVELANYFEVSAGHLLGIGIYENQDVILRHRTEVEKITKFYLPKEYVPVLSKLNDLDFLAVLDLVFKKIQYSFDKNGNKPEFYTVPRFSMPSD